MTITCELCHGIGYLHRVEGDYARAVVCECQTHCEACGGARYIFEHEGGYEVTKPCHCHGVFTRVAYFNEAGVPAGYGQKAIAGFKNRGGTQGKIKTQLLNYQKKFDPNASRGLLLYGPPGTGKTHLVCGLLNYFTLERGIRCYFVDFFQLTARIKATFDEQGGESQEDILRPLAEVPVLVIDELGKGLGTPWELNIIDQLISRRYNAGRIVLATTNYKPEATSRADRIDSVHAAPSLQDRIGLRIWSRLAEICALHEVNGPDHRLRA